MFTEVLCQNQLLLRQTFRTQMSRFYCTTKSYAIVKKTPSVPENVMGLGKSKKGIKLTRTEMPVETDSVKLVQFVCGSNIYKTGEDVKIKEYKEYPEWLWSLNLGRAPYPEEMDINTKQYWLRVRSVGMKRNNKLRAMRKF